jgi:creatinine amidohydrolase
MRLDRMTWPEVGAHLAAGGGVLLPAGSTEQHGPMGLIGTDALCATAIAERAAPLCGAVVAPTLALSPAPFNTAFPGTISISAGLFAELAAEVLAELWRQGFAAIYVLNGHGANLAPLEAAIGRLPQARIRLRSWWAFDEVAALRRSLYGRWEGMHATPSEIAITQATDRVPPVPPAALDPPRALDDAYLRDHAGDRHGPPEAHRRDFPDGRVGSHSALARPGHGHALLDAAVRGVVADYSGLVGGASTRADSRPDGASPTAAAGD